MSFENEQVAFEEYAKVLPNNCIFLVDTYNTLDGVRHAIDTARQLRQAGHQFIGIRLDSGDLAYLKLVGRLRTGNPRARADESEVREFFAPYAPWAGLVGAHLLAARRSVGGPVLTAPAPAGTRSSARRRRSAAA